MLVCHITQNTFIFRLPPSVCGVIWEIRSEDWQRFCVFSSFYFMLWKDGKCTVSKFLVYLNEGLKITWNYDFFFLEWAVQNRNLQSVSVCQPEASSSKSRALKASALKWAVSRWAGLELSQPSILEVLHLSLVCPCHGGCTLCVAVPVGSSVEQIWVRNCQRGRGWLTCTP